MDRFRSAPRNPQFAPLARVPGVHLFSLQKGPGAEQLAADTECFPVTDLDSRLADFMDTAAVLKNLDLVVSVDTAIAQPGWGDGDTGLVCGPALRPPYWRWLMGREDSPWYSTMRLFRQPRPGQWEEVFHPYRRGAATAAGLATAVLRPTTVEIARGS